MTQPQQNPLEFLLVKFDPPLPIRQWVEIKQQAVEDDLAKHMTPHFWRGELIGIMFDDAASAIMFKLSTTYPTKS